MKSMFEHYLEALKAHLDNELVRLLICIAVKGSLVEGLAGYNFYFTDQKLDLSKDYKKLLEEHYGELEGIIEKMPEKDTLVQNELSRTLRRFVKKPKPIMSES